MFFSEEKINEIEKLVLHQLHAYWIDIDDNIIHRAIPRTLAEIEENFRLVTNRRFYNADGVMFSPYHSVHWTLFLYRLAHNIYISYDSDSTPKEADMVYNLNKVMHSVDWFYAVDLPIHLLAEHPIGSVLGRAKYGDFLLVYQGTTIGGNRRGNQLYYPTLGNCVTLYANATVLGDTIIGDNVIVAADAYIINETVPDNCIVFGKSPNLQIKRISQEEMKKTFEISWKER